MALHDLFDLHGVLQTDQRPQFSVLLVQYLGVPEMVGQLKSTLVPRIAQVANLRGIIPLPPLTMELSIKGFYVGGVDEVDERVPNITLIL